jgi:hypothetical protein
MLDPHERQEDPNRLYLGAMDVEISFDGTAFLDPDGDPLGYDWEWGRQHDLP